MAETFTLDGFWEKSDYAKEHHPPATEKAVNEVESKYNVTFPEIFKQLYLLQNGGTVKKDFYQPGKSEEAQHPFVEDWFKLNEFETMKELASTIDFGDTSDWTKKLKNSEKLLIITRHGNDSMLCLDFRKSTNDPEVVVFDTLDEVEEILRVKSFDDFYKGLKADEG